MMRQFQFSTKYGIYIIGEQDDEEEIMNMEQNEWKNLQDRGKIMYSPAFLESSGNSSCIPLCLMSMVEVFSTMAPFSSHWIFTASYFRFMDS